MVSWAWPPVGRIGSLRPVGLAREWVSSGHEVHVITGPGDRGGEYTPDLLPRAAASGAVVHRATAPGISVPNDRRPAFARRADELVAPRTVSRFRQILSQWRHFPDRQRSWIRPASELAFDLNRQRQFDVVFSTSPPESAHFVANALATHGMPWIADFRDQWSDYLLARWDPASRLLIDRIARRVLARAAFVTGATEGVAASLRRARRPTFCVRNGFDPVPRSHAIARSRCLGYFGRIDPRDQHPARLWEPLRVVRGEGSPWTVEFFTAPGGGGGATILPPNDLSDLVRVYPALPHQEALEAMQRMTALLVLAWETRGGETSVAGKLYEYVGAGRPILVCAPEGFEARRLVESTGTGLGAWGVGPIANALHSLSSFRPSAGGRETLSRAHSATQLLECFREAIESVKA